MFVSVGIVAVEDDEVGGKTGSGRNTGKEEEREGSLDGSGGLP